jgi:hypothetical protein
MNGVRITGLNEAREVLRDIGPREGKNLMNVTVFDIAKQAAAKGREYSPHNTGTLDANTKAKRERGDRYTVRSSVRVGPEAFYWFFLEYGHGPDGVEHAMFLKALQSMRPEIGPMFLETFTRKFEAALARKAKRKR